jgi:hypothetical protein
MGMLGLKLILVNPWLGFGSLALLFTLTRMPRCPAAPLGSLPPWSPDGRPETRDKRPISRSRLVRRTLSGRAGPRSCAA